MSGEWRGTPADVTPGGAGEGAVMVSSERDGAGEYDADAERTASDAVVAAYRRREAAEYALKAARAVLKAAEAEHKAALRRWTWARFPGINRDCALAEAADGKGASE